MEKSKRIVPHVFVYLVKKEEPTRQPIKVGWRAEAHIDGGLSLLQSATYTNKDMALADITNQLFQRGIKGSAEIYTMEDTKEDMR